MNIGMLLYTTMIFRYIVIILIAIYEVHRFLDALHPQWILTEVEQM